MSKIKVTKKELIDRTFIPYEIIITVSSEREHKQLADEMYEIESSMRNRLGLSRASKYQMVSDLVGQLSKHTT